MLYSTFLASLLLVSAGAANALSISTPDTPYVAAHAARGRGSHRDLAARLEATLENDDTFDNYSDELLDEREDEWDLEARGLLALDTSDDDPVKTTTTSHKTTSTKSSAVSTSTKASTSPNASNPSHKSGLGWKGSNAKMSLFRKKGQLQFMYTWNAVVSSNAEKLGFTFCPMLWGTKNLADFRTKRTKYGKCMIGMNEVNHPAQANMSPSAAAALWNAEIRPWGLKGYTLISPSVCFGRNGLDWFAEFFAICKKKSDGQANCGVDFLNLHMYTNDPQAFITYIKQAHTKFGIDIWVTEFACVKSGVPCSASQVKSFLQTTTAWMKSQTWIGAFFYYGMMPNTAEKGIGAANALMTSQSVPNTLGSYYLGL